MIKEEANEKCYDCAHLELDMTCEVYSVPQHMHSRLGGCPMSTVMKSKVEMEHKALDPIKASKRAAKGK